jgi:hypothetical protein
LRDLTHVELLWLEKHVEHRIRFGRPAQERILDCRRRVLSFTPGSVFAFVRWQANDFGTIVSRLDILRAVRSSEACATVPYVRPGGDILLRISGWAKVKHMLQMIDIIEALGIDAAEAAPDYWRHIHNRLSAGEALRPYSPARHKAWLLRRRLGS